MDIEFSTEVKISTSSEVLSDWKSRAVAQGTNLATICKDLGINQSHPFADVSREKYDGLVELADFFRTNTVDLSKLVDLIRELNINGNSIGAMYRWLLIEDAISKLESEE